MFLKYIFLPMHMSLIELAENDTPNELAEYQEKIS